MSALRNSLLALVLVCAPLLAEPTEDPCAEVVEAYELSIIDYEKAQKDRDKLIGELRDQRDQAIRQGGPDLLDALPWVLIGGAAATLIIGIRR